MPGALPASDDAASAKCPPPSATVEGPTAVPQDRARVGEPSLGLADPALLERLAAAEWVAIDAPFGWPEPMVAATHAYATAGRWPGLAKQDFRYRLTDRFVHDHVLSETEQALWPLSPSSERLALTVWRLAALREALAERSGLRFDRTGADRVLEAYPAAALLLWGLPRSGYKASAEARLELLAAIEAQAPWLDWEPGACEVCLDSDDALDAVLCALIARAAAFALTVAAPPSDLGRAQAEGWIHLPRKGSLGELLSDHRG